MEYVIKGFDHTALHYFEEISAIPRMSGREGEIASYLERFAAREGLFCYRDAANNVLIRKDATKGRENEPCVLLQAHTDMVTEKIPGSPHDFTKDPLTLIEQGNLLRADGTTLGADDGMGVSMMLAVLHECDSHPPLECLFTATEETGLCGAVVFDFSHIRARYMVNLDSSEEQDVIVGCCGGQRVNVYIEPTRECVSGKGICISVSGLCGGHSGEDIHRSRTNALLVVRGMIAALTERMPVRIASLEGGTRENVIPRECRAVIDVPDPKAALSLLTHEAKKAREALVAPEDASMVVTIDEAPFNALFAAEDTDRILHVLGLPSGVLEWRDAERRLVQTSRNIASITDLGDRVRIGMSTRSPRKEVLARELDQILAYADEARATLELVSEYPGWESEMDSPFVRAWRDAYRRVTGKDVSVTVIHAGLECGVICSSVAGLEAIAVGCNIHNLHSPDECMELDSYLRIYETLLAYLSK